MGSAVEPVEPRIREQLPLYLPVEATVIAERIGWTRASSCSRSGSRCCDRSSAAAPRVAHGLPGALVPARPHVHRPWAGLGLASDHRRSGPPGRRTGGCAVRSAGRPALMQIHSDDLRDLVCSSQGAKGRRLGALSARVRDEEDGEG